MVSIILIASAQIRLKPKGNQQKMNWAEARIIDERDPPIKAGGN
jgi:hypothetical protein